MKYFLLSSVFAVTFAFALCAPQVGQPDIEREDKAKQECNVTFPVTQDPRALILASVMSGERIENPKNLSNLWCHLECFLQKMKFLDENADLRAPGVFKFAVKNIPELASNNHVFMVQLFQIYRSTKGMKNDKCFKTYITFHQFANAVFTIGVAEEINKDLNVREEVLKAISEGKPLPQSLKKDIMDYLKFMNAVLQFYASTVPESSLIPAFKEEDPTAVPKV